MTRNDLKSAVRLTMEAVGFEATKSVFTRFRVERISDVKQQDYPAFVAALAGLCGNGHAGDPASATSLPDATVAEGVPPGASTFAPTTNGMMTLTIGVGRDQPVGKRLQLHHAGQVVEVLSKHTGAEAWVSFHEFEGDHRAKENWRSSCAIVHDIDFHDEAGAKATPPAAQRALLEQHARKIGATLYYATPHGGRVGFVLREQIRDAVAWVRAARALGARLDSLLHGTGFSVDTNASYDRARLYWTPTAMVDGEQRSAVVQTFGEPVDIESLLPAHADTKPEPEDSAMVEQEAKARALRERVAGRSGPFDQLEDAAEAYRQQHPLKDEFIEGHLEDRMFASSTALDCPLCGHHGCLSLNLKLKDRAFCFSTNHEKHSDGRGRKTANGFMFDVVDLHAHKAGMTREEFLRQQGLFDPVAAMQAVFPDLGPEPEGHDPLVDFNARFDALLRAGGNDGVLVPGLLARGRITNIGAAPKSGKSTFIMAALAGFTEAEPRELHGFGKPDRPLRVLYLSENHADDDAVTFRAFCPVGGQAGSGWIRGVDPVAIPTQVLSSWRAFLRWVAQLVQQNGCDVVVLDTFERWVPDIEDSNAAAQVAARYGELSRVIGVGCNVAVVCVLHTKKGADPLDFEALLGSTKFRASSDINLLLVRHRPDDPTDSRIVVRREMRDPFGLIRNVCGRLPASVPEKVRAREHGGPTRLCYRIVGKIEVDAEAHEFARLSLQPEAVPAEWTAASPSAGPKLAKGTQQRLDEQLVLDAARLHAAEKGAETPVSPRRLLDDGFLERARQKVDLPPGYSPPAETRVRHAASRLVQQGRLRPHGSKGVTVVEETPFQKLDGNGE
jgi:hypothetical protein